MTGATGQDPSVPSAMSVHGFADAHLVPPPALALDGRPRRQLRRPQGPGAAGAHDREQALDDLTVGIDRGATS